AVSGSKKAVTLTTSECVGAESLIQLLKNYSRNQKIKTSITVGIIGFPNVGKSSLINSLKRSRVCGVGSTPGFTKFVQEIQLDSKLKLLDCPGIVFNSPVKSQKLDKTAVAEMMLRNCVKVELLDDPIAPVELIISRCNPQSLQVMYNVPAFMGTRDFLVHLARQRGLLKRQGIADLNSAALIILNDWNKGKIPYYTLPPGMSQNTASGRTAAGDAAAAHGAERAVVVSGWAKEFDIDALLGDIDSKTLADANADSADNRNAVVMEGRTVVQDAEMQMQMDAGSDDSDSEYDSADSDDDDDAMEEDEEESPSAATTYIVDLPKTVKNKAATRNTEKDVVIQSTVSSSSAIKAEQRKLKKKQAKLAARAQANAANAMVADESDGDDGDDSYNFGAYFKPSETNDSAGISATAADSDSDEDL
ncbi:nuclear GTP-binding protein nug1, partial [Coemansia sp. RSA 2703]